MKTKNKKLISLMLAGTMVAGVGAMAAGCKADVPEDGSGVSSCITETPMGKNLIVVLYFKKATVHKADVTILHDPRTGGYRDYYAGHKFYTKCKLGGEKGVTTSMYDIMYEVPSKELVDEICEECFGQNK